MRPRPVTRESVVPTAMTAAGRARSWVVMSMPAGEAAPAPWAQWRKTGSWVSDRQPHARMIPVRPSDRPAVSPPRCARGHASRRRCGPGSGAARARGAGRGAEQLGLAVGGVDERRRGDEHRGRPGRFEVPPRRADRTTRTILNRPGLRSPRRSAAAISGRRSAGAGLVNVGFIVRCTVWPRSVSSRSSSSRKTSPRGLRMSSRAIVTASRARRGASGRPAACARRSDRGR